MQKGNRRRSKAKREYRELDFSTLKMSLPHTVIKRGVEYQVQQTTGSNAEEGKTWVCPVCVISIEPGVVHTVAWDLHRGVQTRRHFHNHCFKIFDGELF
ncbi:MAG: hypothetical protein RL418_360 [Actinomycetota bacterium]|jgi:hypothetical protein